MTSFNFVKPSQIPADQASQRLDGIAIDCEDRWQVYHRLQELDISCQCGGFQPLKVEIRTVTEALQLWSVVRRVSQPRHTLAEVLMQSWRLPCKGA